MYADDERKSEVQPEDDVQEQSEPEVPKEGATEVDESSDSETPTDGQEAAKQEPEVDTQDMSSDEQEPAPDAEADAPDVDVYGLLRLFVSMMAEQAWINLGLQTAPGKTETEARLPEARVAIDTLQFLRQQLEQSLEDSEKRELDRMISTLQVNYIQRT